MASTARELFDAARRQYAKREGGKWLATLYIGVPHQLPPWMKDSDSHPPETDGEMPDQYVDGDHDCQAVMRLIDGPTYQGHQSAKVRRLAEVELDRLLPSHWQERLLCELYAGHPWNDPDFRLLANDLDWADLYPEVDFVLNPHGDFCMTGEVVGADEEGYANVFHEAMISEDAARKAGLVVEEGSVYRKEVSDG
jgi:hypothetical protein